MKKSWCVQQMIDKEGNFMGFLQTLLTLIFKVEALQHILIRYNDRADELLFRSEKNADKVDLVL